MTTVNQMPAQTKSKSSWLKVLAKVFGIVLILLIVSGLIAQRMSDGPTQFIPGGKLRSGVLVTEPDIDWSLIDVTFVELQLVKPMGSRTTGTMLYEGQLYIPCDLGFMWRRFSGAQSMILHGIWIFKRWHKDALIDGRVVLRIDGKRYERQAVKVTDPVLLDALRLQLEEQAVEYFGGPLPDAQTNPEDIWFFRMDPRPASKIND